MKIIALGDIHGRETWKEVIKKETDFDKLVFVGDYFDAFPPMTTQRIFDTFKEILAYKAAYPDKVVLLMGNHDFQYTPWGIGEQYSGYNPVTKLNLEEIGEWWKWLVPAYQYQDILFSHAGLTKTWAEEWFPKDAFAAMAADWIKATFDNHPKAFKFYPEDKSRCGDDPHQSPFWVRPDALLKDIYDGLRMVVGHTHVQTVQSVGPLTQIDSGKEGSYLKIIDGVMHTGHI